MIVQRSDTPRGLGEAVQQFVLANPEVVALMDRTGMRDRFDGGQCPLRLSDYHWPLDAKASDFEFRLTQGVGILILGEPAQTPTRDVCALSAALTNGLGTLRDSLCSGRVQAWGFTAQFEEQPIPARVWTRRNLSIDVVNGDLCEVDDRGNVSTLWTSVELRSATTESIQIERPVEPVPSSRKRRPKGQEIELILREKKIDVDALGRKAAAVEVARHMKSPPSSDHGTKALETMVGRIWKTIRNAH